MISQSEMFRIIDNPLGYEKLYKKDHEPLPEEEYAYVEGWDEF